MIKYLLLFALLIDVPDVSKIARHNQVKTDAQEALDAGDFESAIAQYHLLIDTMGVTEPEALYNLSTSYYQLADTTNAKLQYGRTITANNKQLSSKSYNQLGVISNLSKNHKKALSEFKSALKQNPSNENARFNYELTKKLLEQQQEQENQDDEKKDDEKKEDNKEKEEEKDQEQKDKEKQDQEKQDQEQQDQQDQQQGEENDEENEQEQQEQQDKNQEGKEEEQQEPNEEEQKEQSDKEKQDAVNQKLEEMKISPEKAQMILEALKNREKQYIQQMTRKATKKPPSGKPDW